MKAPPVSSVVGLRAGGEAPPMPRRQCYSETDTSDDVFIEVTSVAAHAQPSDDLSYSCKALGFNDNSHRDISGRSRNRAPVNRLMVPASSASGGGGEGGVRQPHHPHPHTNVVAFEDDVFEDPRADQHGPNSHHHQHQQVVSAPATPSASAATTSAATKTFKTLVRKVSQRVSNNKKQEHPLRRRASRRSRAGSVRSRHRRQGSANRSSPAIRKPLQAPPTPTVGGRRASRSDPEGGGVVDTPYINQSGNALDDKSTASQKLQRTPQNIKAAIVRLIESGWQQIQLILGTSKEEEAAPEVIIKEPVLDELELPHRYRPDNIQLLCDATGFNIDEMKRIYRGFKTECPTGLITEETFHDIYSRFFPHGANISSYSHYVFSTLDHEDTGVITFENFVLGLSILLRGSLEDKLRWTFSLYDQDKDGFISREEMEDVVGSVFDLMGRTADPLQEEEVIGERVDIIFEKLDLNGDGVVSMEEFLEACTTDETIYQSVNAFTNCSV